MDEEKLPEDTLEEETPVEESPVEDAERDTDDESVTAEELKAELEEIGSRVKTAGLKPFRKMVRLYVDNMLDAVDGLLGALEGNKRKGG